MADSLAKDGALLPDVPHYVPLSEAEVSALIPISSYTLTVLGDDATISTLTPKVTYQPLLKSQAGAREALLGEDPCADTESDHDSDSDFSDAESGVPTQERDSHRSHTLVYASQQAYKKRLREASSEKDMWCVIHDMMYARRTLNVMPVVQLFESFQRRMNPPSSIPPSFNANVLLCHQMASDTTPHRTVDKTADAVFSSPITEDEIAAAKAHLHKRAAESSTSGLDGVGYGNFLEIDNDILANLFNECLDTLETPTQWLTTVLAAILKKGKARDDPEGYRAIALESCGLKFMTLLIHKRLMRWCENHKIIPDSQNGFREGHRTNDNVFILRATIERAHAEGKTLYVAFADLSNAFPATNHACLWAKMQRLGAGGKIFDWLRLLYAEMTYMV